MASAKNVSLAIEMTTAFRKATSHEDGIRAVAEMLDKREEEIRDNESSWWKRTMTNPIHDLNTLRGIAENYPTGKG